MNKHKEIIKKSCDLIKKSIKELSLKNLANQFDLSPSYFQKLFKQETGITPKEYKKGGTAKKIMVAIGDCSLGHVLVGQSNKGICSILLGNNPEELLKEFEKIFPNAEISPGNESFENNVSLVIAFVDMPKIG